MKGSPWTGKMDCSGFLLYITFVWKEVITAMAKRETVEEVFLREGYSSQAEAMNDWALFLALSKVEQYRAECEFFERKYAMKLEQFEQSIHVRKGREDFENEDDLDDWEFSNEAVKWWQSKVRDLQNAEST
jgi:hypothetical protein